MWIDADGCSCWDGDWGGWELELDELHKLADKAIEGEYDWRETADVKVAKWIKGNL